mmetsp:Transcript_21771/g.40960  ORF Transcript_21771/g.40960 Transcript_21771/m.40960 type:complete len:246 (+) Transcript_21771:182-919(+)
MPQQQQSADAEEGVKDVRDVVRPVRDPSLVRVLALQNERRQALPVDPAPPPYDFQARQDPPAVAHVALLLRPPVQAPSPRLPLGQPPRQQVYVDQIQPLGYAQRRHAREYLPRVALRPAVAPEPPVEVLAAPDELRRLPDVHAVQGSQDGQAAESAVAEPGVDLPVLVAREAPVIVLETFDVTHDLLRVHRVQLFEHRKDLQGAESVKQVRVVADVPPEAPGTLVPALHHPLEDLLGVHKLVGIG